MNALPPAGWYDDPENPGYLRYWDATKWTDHRSPHGSSTSGKLSDVGTWLNDTFVSIWEAKRPVLALGGILLAAWAVAAGVSSWALGDVVYINDGWQGFQGDRMAVSVLVSLVAAAISLVMYLALIHQLHTRRGGDAPPLGASVAAAGRAAPRAIGWTLAILLAALVAFVGVIVLAVLIGSLVILVILALIPVAIWLWIKLSFLLVACVVPAEGSNAIKASAHVSSGGRFWAVLGRLLLLSIIAAVIAFIVGIPFGSVAGGGDIDAVLVTDAADDIESFHLGNLLDEAGFGGGALVLLSAIPQMVSSLLTMSGSTDLYAQVHGRPRN